MNQNIRERIQSLLDLPQELHRHQEMLRHQKVEYENFFGDLTKDDNINVEDLIRLQERYFDSITLAEKQIELLGQTIRQLEDSIIEDIRIWARGLPVVYHDASGYTFVFTLQGERLSVNRIAA